MYQVIIIEDDPMVAAINKQYVELTPSFRVAKMFRSGIEALEYLEDKDADLIILDYFTPLMNGAEFIDRLHATGKAPSVIMVTSAGDTEIVASLLSRGVIDYLVKPFEYARFKAALDKYSQQKEYLSRAGHNMAQGAIDMLLTHRESGGASASTLAKGLSESTLNLIRSFLKENREALYSSEQIAEQIHLSRITIRRYMNYMVETGELVSSIDYQTGGRPSIRYRYVKSSGIPVEPTDAVPED